MALYDELRPIQTQLEANGLRLRFGVVPYSTTVNVGRLISGADTRAPGGGLPGNPDYLTDSAPFPTRIGDYDDYRTNQLSQDTDTQTYGSSLTSAECDQYGVNAGYPTLNGQPAATGGPPPAPVDHASSIRGATGAQTGDTSGTNRTCRRNRTTTITQTGFFASRWMWRQEDGGHEPVQAGHAGSDRHPQRPRQ